MKKVYDLAVKTGSYTVNGEEKNRYLNIGSIMEGNSGPFMMLNRSFNPAGVPFKEGSDAVLVSMFEPKEKGAGRSESAPPRQDQHDDPSDDVPF